MAVDQVRLVEAGNREIVVKTMVRLHTACQRLGVSYEEYEKLVAFWMALSASTDEPLTTELISAHTRLLELGCPPLEHCPGCTVMLPPGHLQMNHMTQRHPEIVQERQVESARWDGWEDD